MATAPMKSQPLHNFSLPFLKWGHKNQVNNNHRFRRPPEPTVRNRSPQGEQQRRRRLASERDTEPEWEKGNMSRIGSRSFRQRFSFASCSSLKQQQQREEPGREQKNDVVERERCEERDVERERVCEEGGAGEECVGKPWNLRPRKVVKRAAVEIGAGVFKNGDFPESIVFMGENMQPKSMRLRGFVEGQGSERKEKRKFWISLSREEIEEDVYALTGAKPSRRPRKRPRIIQKQVDNVFPGLYLVGATADSYRVHDSL